MKRLYRALALSVFALLASVSAVFADIAPLPDDPQPESGGPRIALILGIVLIALIVLRIALRNRRK